MNPVELRDRLNELINDGHGQWPMVLTDVDDNGAGHVYEIVDVDILTGDDGEWINLDIRIGDLP